MLNVLFVLKILRFYFDFFDKKDKTIFKICDVTNWTTNNYNTHIAQYLKQ